MFSFIGQEKKLQQVHPRMSCQKLAISKAEMQWDTLYQKLESPESTEYQGDGIHHHQFSSPAETSVFWESESCANYDFPKLSIWVKVKVTVKVMHGDAKSRRAVLVFNLM